MNKLKQIMALGLSLALVAASVVADDATTVNPGRLQTYIVDPVKNRPYTTAGIVLSVLGVGAYKYRNEIGAAAQSGYKKLKENKLIAGAAAATTAVAGLAYQYYDKLQEIKPAWLKMPARVSFGKAKDGVAPEGVEAPSKEAASRAQAILRTLKKPFTWMNGHKLATAGIVGGLYVAHALYKAYKEAGDYTVTQDGKRVSFTPKFTQRLYRNMGLELFSQIKAPKEA